MKKVIFTLLWSMVFLLSAGAALSTAQPDKSADPIRAISNPQQPITATTDSAIELQLRSGAFDPLKSEPSADSSSNRVLAANQPELWLVQFTGPIQDEWYAAMTEAGVDVITYMPDYAYLVWGDEATIQKLQASAPVRWAGLYQPQYALAPSLAQADQLPAEVDVVVQLIDQPAADVTMQLILTQAKPLSDPQVILTYRNWNVRIASDQLNWLAALPAVVNVEPMPHYQKLDEVQGQIMAGNLNAGGTQPNGPGYLYWLTNTIGFTTTANAYPIVDVTDDGIDDGSATPRHADFWTAGMTTTVDRLIYNTNWTVDALADGLAGHGNINASIVAGYNDRTGSAYEDGNGYNYGLGINPFGRVAGSKIFNNTGNWDLPGNNYTGLISRTYSLGGRISSNSWGANTGGAYTTDSQAYDALVRDAQPGTGVFAGNQPMITVFAAGNAGAGANTVGAPGGAKNVISVGAAENYRPTWTDGCAVGPTGADNAQDIINFSSRGPMDDQRVKPDIVAPGTHIEGAASQDPAYNGSGVCDQYMPTAQTLYAASSGTSHSTPAIAGAASLLYRYYQDHFGGQPPSPAMVKAYLLNATRYLTGTSANDTLPSNNQGFGEVYLSRAFDNTPRFLIDQSYLFSNTNQVYQISGVVPDTTKPFRVTLAWTDAPGATVGNAYVNNLDLAVTINGNTYRGNVFSGAASIAGGTADARNNVESVFLPAGTGGYFTVVITATNLAGDGVPGNGDTTDQDFALVVYNGITGVQTGAIAGTVTDAATAAPIANAQVSAAAGSVFGSTTTNAAGQYTLTNLITGTYAVTATAFGYLPNGYSNVSVVGGVTTTRNITLTMLPRYVVSGTVSDAATGWPLYANVGITPYSGGAIWTDPATGFYSVTLPVSTSFTFNVSAAGGYTPATRTVGPLSTNRTENFALTMNNTLCSAPGYQLTSSALFTESFDTITAFPGGGWAQVDTSGTAGNWATATNTVHPAGGGTHSGARLAYFNSWTSASGSATRLYRTTGLNLSSFNGGQATVWVYHDTGYTTRFDNVQLQISNNGGGTWNDVGAAINRYDGSTGWKLHTIDLGGYTGPGQTDVRLAFLGNSVFGNDVHIDDVTITGTLCSPQTGGLVVGNVYDGGTLAALSSATVAKAGGSTTTDANGFYTLFSPSGSRTFTATMPGYTAGVSTINIVTGTAQRLDFYLLLSTSGITWTGNTSTNWFVASNWNPVAVPATTSGVIIPAAPTGNRWPILTGTATIYSLTVQSSAVLTVAQNALLNVDGVVYNYGALAQIKNVPAGSTTEFLHITNAASNVDKYHGVDLTPTAAMGVTTIQIKGNQAACTTVPADPIVHRCYRIDPTTQTAATVRFWYTEAERNAQFANALKLWHWSPWTQVGSAANYTYSESGTTCTSGSGQACWFQSTGVSNYSPFALGSGGSPTAIRLAQISAASTSTLPIATLSAIALLGLSLGVVAANRRRI